MTETIVLLLCPLILMLTTGWLFKRLRSTAQQAKAELLDALEGAGDG